MSLRENASRIISIENCNRALSFFRSDLVLKPSCTTTFLRSQKIFYSTSLTSVHEILLEIVSEIRTIESNLVSQQCSISGCNKTKKDCRCLHCDCRGWKGSVLRLKEDVHLFNRIVLTLRMVIQAIENAILKRLNAGLS